MLSPRTLLASGQLLLLAIAAFLSASILNTWGGRPLKLKSVAYRGGTKKYADYTAYKHLELKVEDETGSEDELRLGSIAEVGGVYKFISYIRK